jgi:ATP-binding cassette subfamily B protein
VGKTTLLSLIPRFYDPAKGRILIDGPDIRDLTRVSLRRQIGIVQQDVFLLGGTMRENIANGRLDATEEEIVEAARRARLGDLIETLPEGIDTIVGERGVTLSGGQKQRLAIARAFLRNPPILILDEATSALDTETERKIQGALDELSVNRTTLVIAHRLNTIRRADLIVVMDEGKVIEQGTDEDLRARSGVSSAEEHRGSRPAAAAYGAETSRPSLPPPPSGPSSAVLSDRSSDPPGSLACATSQPSSD